MMKVRSEEIEKKSLFHRLFFPPFVKIPIQTVAVLFVAVCAFYIYRRIEPSSRPGELLLGRFSTVQHDAGPELSTSNRPQDGLRKKEYASLPSQQVPQLPAYKSLDMKLEYEAPSPPVNGGEETVPASGKPKQAKQETPGGESLIMEKVVPAPRAPAETNRQAAVSREKTPRAEVKQGLLALAGKAKALAKEPASSGSSASSEETEAMLIKKIGDYFINHDLPRTGHGKDVKYGVSKFEVLPENAPWLDAGMQKKMASCKNTYLVDVLSSEILQKYFYCADDISIELLFMVAQKNGRLIKIE